MDRISDLPKDILLRILYFLSQEDAVRTSVLSKPWRYNWCTRSNLDLSDKTFKGKKHKFTYVVDKTLQRYCDQRLCLKEFCLRISSQTSSHESVRLLEKWIPSLTIMGVKKFCLSITCDNSRFGRVKLPHAVFGEESLQDLCVKGFMLDQEGIERIPLSKNLKKLHLELVFVEDDTSKTIICPPSLESINITCSNVSLQQGVDIRNLIALQLSGVTTSIDHLPPCKFPSLKRLILSYCVELKESEVFIDAPNMVYFEFSGDFVPSISFSTTEWDSYIYVESIDAFSSWLVKLRKLLKSIRRSHICLSIRYDYPRYAQDIIQENIMVQDDGCDDDKPIAVESLKLNCELRSFSALLNGLLRVCRPRDIGNIVNRIWGVKVTELVWNMLMQRESGDQDQFIHELWFQDLEEASLEMKETNKKEWHSISSLSELSNYYDNIRFALKWRQTL